MMGVYASGTELMNTARSTLGAAGLVSGGASTSLLSLTVSVSFRTPDLDRSKVVRVVEPLGLDGQGRNRATGLVLEQRFPARVSVCCARFDFPLRSLCHMPRRLVYPEEGTDELVRG